MIVLLTSQLLKMKMCRCDRERNSRWPDLSPVLSDEKLLKVSSVAPGLRDLIGPVDNLSCWKQV